MPSFTSLELPKYISITNWKLNLFYYILEIAMLILLMYRFVSWKQNSVQAIPQGRVVAWADGHHDRDRPGLVAAMDKLNETLCKNPGIYEYWWDDTGDWIQGPHTCLKLCNANGARADAEACIRPSETYIQEASDQLFFVTEFQERYMDTESNSRYYFVPTTDAMTLGFEYSFSIFDNGPFESNTLSGIERVYATEFDILTVVVDQNNEGAYNVQYLVEPGTPITFTVEKMLQLASRDLDIVQPRAGRNFLPGSAFPTGPLTRIAGVDLLVFINCFAHLDDAPIDVDKEWEGPACILEVRPAQSYWSSLNKVEVIEPDGSLRRRLYHGVRVRFTIGGSYYFFDFNKVLVNLASCLVYMAVPGKFMLIFIVYFLGHLSIVYTEALFERCDIVDQCAGMTARLMSMCSCFGNLTRAVASDDIPSLDESVDGISKEMLKKQLTPVATTKLSEEGVERLLNFCFYTLADASSTVGGDKSILRVNSLLGKLTTPSGATKLRNSLQERAENISKHFHATATGRVSRVREDDLITLEDFTIAHASNEPFSFNTFMELFDSKRGYTCLEYVFTPRHIRVAREKSPSALLKRGSSRSDDLKMTISQRTVYDIRYCFGRCRKSIRRRWERLQRWRERSEPKASPSAGVLEPTRDDTHQTSHETADPTLPSESGSVNEAQNQFNSQLLKRVKTLEHSLRETQDKLAATLKALTARLDGVETNMKCPTSEPASGSLSPNIAKPKAPRASRFGHSPLPVPEQLAAPDDHIVPSGDPLEQEMQHGSKPKKHFKSRKDHSKTVKSHREHSNDEMANVGKIGVQVVGSLDISSSERPRKENASSDADVFSDDEPALALQKKPIRTKGTHHKKASSGIHADKIGAEQNSHASGDRPHETHELGRGIERVVASPLETHHSQGDADHMTADTLRASLQESRRQLRASFAEQ